jgi:hypothetical protein
MQKYQDREALLALALSDNESPYERKNPHPDPLPEYKERGNEGDLPRFALHADQAENLHRLAVFYTGK